MHSASGPPAATLLVPLLNQDDGYLTQAMESAVAQTPDCEILVVTSARTCTSNRAIVDRFASQDARVRVMEQRRPGFPQALNEGIEASRANRLGILLTDDWLAPTAIEESLRVDADITSTQMLTFAADGVTPVHRPWKAATNAVYRTKTELEHQAAYLQHFFLLRKEKVLEAGGVDESLGDTPGIDDYHLIWSMLEHGATAAIVEKPLYHYRDHAGLRLTLHERGKMVETMRRVMRKHGLSGQKLEAALERHAMWFGRTMQEVIAERRSKGLLPDMNGLIAEDYARDE